MLLSILVLFLIRVIFIILHNLVGHAKAAELSMLGEKVSAEEAVELGLATK